MTIESQDDIDQLSKIGRIVAIAIKEMKKSAEAGMTTNQLDHIGRDVLARYGAVSAPKKTYGFPGHTCISINEEVAHGIPGDRVVQAGDLINIDVSAELNGYYADARHSFQIPPYTAKAEHLCKYTYSTMMKVISSLKAGVKLHQVGKTIQDAARKGGYRVVQNLLAGPLLLPLAKYGLSKDS